MDHWPLHARQWSLLGPPLRPRREDVAIVEGVAAAARPRRALVLGVTPELVAMRWPAGTRVLAVDRCEGMVRCVFPRGARGARAALGDWRAMPVRAGAIDLVAGDGVNPSWAFPGDYRRVAAELRRALAPGGLWVLRAFVRPARAEPMDAVIEDLRAGRIGGFHAFKWRLAMALHGAPERGVALREVWATWRARCPDPREVAARLGCAEAEVATIDAYREAAMSYSFPTIEELRAVLAPDFEDVDRRAPAYEIGERCPTLVLRARA